MTDNEIIKALEICASGSCVGCNTHHGYDCVPVDMETVLSLINRQKAEVERLNNHIRDVTKKVKAEAIKEFSERLKETFPQDDFLRSTKRISEDIDNLVKEMVGDDNG